MSSLTKRQKEVGLIGLAVVFLLVLLAYSYFVLYAPARDARAQAEQSLSSEREVLMALENQLKDLPAGEPVSASELQRKVSVDALTDLIVLQIEQAELLSNSLVTAISFTEGPLEVVQPVEGVENIQEVLTSISLEAPDYASITSFIREIEKMERIMVVESINFGANEEVTQLEQEQEALSVTLNFSAFYRPDLIELNDTLPKVDAPPPANKSNPLPQNDGTDLADTEEEMPVAEEDVEVDVDVDVNVEEDSVSSIEASPNPNIAGAQISVVHKVESGDSLSSIALKYFGDSESGLLIQQANNLPDQNIMAGTTLIIPERP